MVKIEDALAWLICRVFGGIIIRSDRLQALLYRWRCPGGGGSVRACIARGECGCDNNGRQRKPTFKEGDKVRDRANLGGQVLETWGNGVKVSWRRSAPTAAKHRTSTRTAHDAGTPGKAVPGEERRAALKEAAQINETFMGDKNCIVTLRNAAEAIRRLALTPAAGKAVPSEGENREAILKEARQAITALPFEYQGVTSAHVEALTLVRAFNAVAALSQRPAQQEGEGK